MINIKQLFSKLIGTIILLFSIAWTFSNVVLIYQYHSGQYLFLVMIPDTLIIFNIMGGAVGILTGYLVLINEIKAYKALLFSFIMYILLSSLVFISIM